MGARICPIGISIRNILKPTRSLYDFLFKGYGPNNGFHDFGDLSQFTMIPDFIKKNIGQ